MSSAKTHSSKELSGQLFRLLPYFLAVLLWAALALYGQPFLKKVEDLSLFLFDRMYLREMMQIPGGFLGMAGSFLTQFLYYPWLGSLIWTFLLILVYQLSVKAFDIPERFRALAIIPAALLVIGNMSLGYGVFIMREQDHFFAPTLGYLVALFPLFATRHLKLTWSRILFLLLWTAAGYPLFGVFALAGTLSASLAWLADTDTIRKDRLTILTAGIALVLIVPLITYNFYTSYRMADSWHLGLPSVSDDLWTRAVRAPFQLAVLFVPVMAVVSRRLSKEGGNIIVQSAVFAASVLAVWGFWFKDDNFRAELAMSQAVDNFDWQKVLDIYADAVNSHDKSDRRAYSARTGKLSGVTDQNEISDIVDKYSKRFFEPTRTMVLYRDLALLKTNRALQEAFTMKDGGRLQKSRTQIPMTFQSGKQFYLQYGLVNMSYRWCLEDVIEHNWSYSTLKYMVMHSVIMQETEFAYKYINKLKKTIFYRKWAETQMQLSHDRALMAASAPYNSILPYMCFDDRMTNDMVKCETFLMRHFYESEPVNATPEYDRAALLWAMRIQDIQFFWQRLYFYINSNKVAELPRGVEEAALLFSKLEKPPFDLPYSKAATDSYEAFDRYVKAKPIRNMNEALYPYSQKFGKTYYFFYYFIRNLQTY